MHTWTVAEETVVRLRKAGLHPVELSLSTPLIEPGAEPTFPIEVPAEEEIAARMLIESVSTRQRLSPS